MASLLFIKPAIAQEATPVMPYHFDESLIASGWTLRLTEGANLTVFPGVLPTPADVLWTSTTDTLPTLPTGTVQQGNAYRLTVSGVTTLDTSKWKLAAALPDVQSLWQKSIWIYDLTAKTWTKLPSKLNTTNNKWQAGIGVTDAYVVLLEDHTIEVGNATWYCKLHCSSRYPKLHGTSNDFPVGSYVTVTNPANHATVTVKIVSRWGQPAGRIIDLSWAAYSQLQPTNKGVTRVTVSPKSTTTTVTPIVATTVKPEIIPHLSVTPAATTKVPTVSASTYRVIDASSGTVLAEKSSDKVLPIASLTKLMTCVVFLDTNPNMRAKFVYQASDGTGRDASGKAYGYNNLTVRPGDAMLVRDLLYATLIGSANNGATALVRASGLTRTEFVARMNAKAKAWGMTGTTFVEPSGLDPANTSTAKDVAIMGTKAFNGYEPIRYVTTKSSYTFSASLSGSHTVRTTDVLLTRNNGLTVTGGKTGYIDEAKYTYVVRVKNAQGAQVVISLLGEPSSTTRFNEAATLATWAWKNFTWS